MPLVKLLRYPTVRAEHQISVLQSLRCSVLSRKSLELPLMSFRPRSFPSKWWWHQLLFNWTCLHCLRIFRAIAVACSRVAINQWEPHGMRRRRCRVYCRRWGTTWRFIFTPSNITARFPGQKNMASSMEEWRSAVTKTRVYNWNDSWQQLVFLCQHYAQHILLFSARKGQGGRLGWLKGFLWRLLIASPSEFEKYTYQYQIFKLFLAWHCTGKNCTETISTCLH